MLQTFERKKIRQIMSNSQLVQLKQKYQTKLYNPVHAVVFYITYNTKPNQIYPHSYQHFTNDQFFQSNFSINFTVFELLAHLHQMTFYQTNWLNVLNGVKFCHHSVCDGTFSRMSRYSNLTLTPFQAVISPLPVR